MPRLFTRLLRLLSALARRLRSGRREPPAPVGPRGHPRRLQTAKPPYDLEKDPSTDHQKYLM